MFGISSSGQESINNVIEQIFDRIALQFIGDLPSLRNTKRLIVSAESNFGLSHLFVQAMANKAPNDLEKDVLKSLLAISNGYIDSLKNKTKSNVIASLDGLVSTAKLQGRKITNEEVQTALDEELGKAGTHLRTVMESESTKLRNLGTMMEISRVAATMGDDDPTVFFVMVKDQYTCKECIRLHTTDGVTPKLWKFSELKQGYHKRGENNPSAFGLHPHCRCTLVYLAQGYGFNKFGKITYVEEGFDAFSAQRK